MESNDLLALDVRQFAAAVADKTPTPGGGSVAGVVGTLATALGEMALNFTRGKKKFAQHEETYAHLAHNMEKARGMFQALVADDVSAYSLYREAAALEEGPAKAEAMQLALAAAINVPRMMTKLAMSMLDAFVVLSDKCNPYLFSDLVAGAALAEATIRLCDYNVRINVPQLTDPAAGAEIRQASADDVRKAKSIRAQLEQVWGK